MEISRKIPCEKIPCEFNMFLFTDRGDLFVETGCVSDLDFFLAEIEQYEEIQFLDLLYLDIAANGSYEIAEANRNESFLARNERSNDSSEVSMNLGESFLHCRDGSWRPPSQDVPKVSTEFCCLSVVNLGESFIECRGNEESFIDLRLEDGSEMNLGESFIYCRDNEEYFSPQWDVLDVSDILVQTVKELRLDTYDIMGVLDYVLALRSLESISADVGQDDLPYYLRVVRLIEFRLSGIKNSSSLTHRATTEAKLMRDPSNNLISATSQHPTDRLPQLPPN